MILKGARQVGKTESIRHFGERSYEHLIEINFVEEPKYKMIIEDGFKAEDIIKNISRIDPSKEFAEGIYIVTATQGSARFKTKTVIVPRGC